MINVTYYSDYVNPSYTNFTLNIIKQKTTIKYDIINNTEGNVQINITVLDENNEPIPDAPIQITGDINNQTTAGIITDNTLLLGDYTIIVNFNETRKYLGSNTTIELIVTDDSEITTDKTTYDHIDGIKNRITLKITDPSEEKGSITITVKDQDEYKKLSSYFNVEDGYQLSTDALVEELEKIYDTLNSSYLINVTYSSECTNPSSTEFTLNIIQKRNTTITYNILNNTEGNVQINITVLDAIYKTPIPDALIQITGALENETTTGIITDNTLKPGKYNITINYNGTED